MASLHNASLQPSFEDLLCHELKKGNRAPVSQLPAKPALMAGRPRPSPVAIAPAYDLGPCSIMSPSIFPNDYVEWSSEPSDHEHDHREKVQCEEKLGEEEASNRAKNYEAQVQDDKRVELLPSRRRSFLGSESIANIFEVAPRGGNRAGLIHCLLVRNRRLGPLSTTEFRLYLQGAKGQGGPNNKLDEDRLLLVATAQTAGAFSIFNMARGCVEGTLTRKSGNFVGEFVRASAPVRSTAEVLGLQRATAYVLHGKASNSELAAAAFHKPSLSRHVHDGPRPRNLNILLPGLNARRRPSLTDSNDNSIDSGSIPSLLKNLQDRITSNRDASPPWVGFRPSKMNSATSSDGTEPRLFKVKAPAFDGTAYRLDFNGRATVPSVKNMQLVEPCDRSDVVLQLAKVSTNDFHLDFKGPFNALQALAVALAQFSY